MEDSIVYAPDVQKIFVEFIREAEKNGHLLLKHSKLAGNPRSLLDSRAFIVPLSIALLAIGSIEQLQQLRNVVTKLASEFAMAADDREFGDSVSHQVEEQNEIR